MAVSPANRNALNPTRRIDNGYLPLSQAVDRLFRESVLLPSMFEQTGWSGVPAGTNLWETTEGFILQFAMPGMKADSINCTIEQNELVCKAESALTAPENAKPVWETLAGQAEFRVHLPAEVDASQAQANYEQGILTITLPKAAHIRPQSIKVVPKK